MSNAPAAAGKPKSKLPLVLIVVALVAAAGAGGFLYRRSSAQATSAAAAAPAATTNVTSVLQLDSFVVNLQDASGNGYLRVTLSLGLAAAATDDKDKQAAYLPRLRDTILGVLGTRTVDELLTPDGKIKLKTDLLAAINTAVPDLQCKEVYFTEFLVQH